MDTVFAIFMAIALSAVSVFLLTLLASAETVRELLVRACFIVYTPLQMLRDGSQTVLGKGWDYMKMAGSSLGIAGEHWVQRLFGSILIAFAAALGVFVGTLGVMVAFEGAFGNSEASIVENIPVSVESLMAIDLAVAGFLFGLLLFDVLGVTHLTKYYSPERLPKWLKHTLSGIFLAGALYTIFLFGLSGYFRASSLFSENQAIASNTADQSFVYIPGENNSVENIEYGDAVSSYENVSEPISEGYMNSISHLMIGVPVISILSGVFSGVGFIAAGGTILVAPVFLALSILFGIFYLIGSVGTRIVDLVYNFVHSFFNIFINIADSIQRYIRNRIGTASSSSQDQGQDISIPQTQQSQQTAEEHTTQRDAEDQNRIQPLSNTNAQEGDHTEEDSPHPATIYSQLDPNWNPFAIVEKEGK